MSEVADQVAAAYDLLAHDFEHSVDVNNAYNTDYERPAMMALLPMDLRGAHVLDAGCAAGWYTEQLLARGAQVTALDFASEMVAATKRRVGDHARVWRHDLTEPLPLADESLEVVLSSLTLHYLRDWEWTFREFARVLRPSGKFIFSVNHPFMDFTKYKGDSYFTTQLLKDQWGVTNRADPVEIQFYRRPMQDVINTTTRFFRLDSMVEPQPVPSFEHKRSAATYQRLMTHPYFLIVVAQKIRGMAH